MRIFGKLVLLLQQEFAHPAEALDYAKRGRSRVFLDQLERHLGREAAEIVLGEPLLFKNARELLKINP